MKVQRTSVDILEFLEKLTYTIYNNNHIYANHHGVQKDSVQSCWLNVDERDRNDE